MQLTRRNKIIAGGLVLTALLLLLITLFRGSTGNNVVVEVVVLPEDSIFTVDGQRTQPGRVSLTRGEHTLKATRKYFEPVEKKINTQTLKPDEAVYLLPEAKSDEALNYLLNNPELQARREQIISGVEFSASQEKIVKDNPAVNDLPYETIDYKIDYTIDEDKKASYQITLYPAAVQPGTAEYDAQIAGYKQQALQYLKRKGVDIDKADITFSH